MKVWLPLVVDLAVRDAISATGFKPQDYPGMNDRRCLFYDPKRMPKYLTQRRCVSWFLWPKVQHPLAPTGHLYFFGDRWGVGLERWYRYANARKETISIWIGVARELTRAMELYAQACRAEVARLVEEVKAMDVEEQLDEGGRLWRYRDDDGGSHETWREMLEACGMHDLRGVFDDLEVGRGQDAERQGQGLGARGRRRVQGDVRAARAAGLAGEGGP